MTSYWNAVGIKTNYKTIGLELYRDNRNDNLVDLAAWGADILDIGEVANRLGNTRLHWGARASGHLWCEWLQSDGEEGEEPPQEIIELWELGEQFLDAPYGSEEWLALGKEFYKRSFGVLYQIGTIQRPPPLLFRNNLKNTPLNDTTGQWSWSYR